MMRRAEGKENGSNLMKHIQRTQRLLLVAGAASLGFYLGLNLSEERKHRVKKLLFEAREMPFRIFV